MSYVEPPRRIPLLLRVLLWLAERRVGRPLAANRILTWYPKAFLGSGIMEMLVAHGDPEVTPRLLSLVRIHTSFLVSCPFCIDMNARDFARKGITEQEIAALQGRIALEDVSTFNESERAALRYVQCMCRTPLSFPDELVEGMRRSFSPRAFVIVTSTCAQVNFWTRLIQSLGVPPAGFSGTCPALDLSAFETRRPTR